MISIFLPRQVLNFGAQQGKIDIVWHLWVFRSSSKDNSEALMKCKTLIFRTCLSTVWIMFVQRATISIWGILPSDRMFCQSCDNQNVDCSFHFRSIFQNNPTNWAELTITVGVLITQQSIITVGVLLTQNERYHYHSNWLLLLDVVVSFVFDYDSCFVLGRSITIIMTPRWATTRCEKVLVPHLLLSNSGYLHCCIYCCCHQPPNHYYYYYYNNMISVNPLLYELFIVPYCVFGRHGRFSIALLHLRIPYSAIKYTALLLSTCTGAVK